MKVKTNGLNRIIKTALLSFVVLFPLNLGKAQEAAPDLITDRPDQTESSAVVPLYALQIETGFVMENKETSIYKQKAFAYNTTLLRYGIFDNMELRLGLEYLKEKHDIKDTDTTNSFEGLSPLYTGFKVKIIDENGWIPEIAFLGAMVLPFTAHKDFKPSYASADMRFSVAHSLSDRLSIGYNLGVEWDGETAIPAYFYSIALGIGISDKLGMFVESYGLVPEDVEGEHLLDAGFTYLIIPNLQVDISGGLGINDQAIDNFLSFGLSCRLPE